MCIATFRWRKLDISASEAYASGDDFEKATSSTRASRTVQLYRKLVFQLQAITHKQLRLFLAAGSCIYIVLLHPQKPLHRCIVPRGEKANSTRSPFPAQCSLTARRPISPEACKSVHTNIRSQSAMTRYDFGLNRWLLSRSECGSETAVGLDADRYSEGECARLDCGLHMSSSTL